MLRKELGYRNSERLDNRIIRDAPAAETASSIQCAISWVRAQDEHIERLTAGIIMDQGRIASDSALTPPSGSSTASRSGTRESSSVAHMRTTAASSFVNSSPRSSKL